MNPPEFTAIKCIYIPAIVQNLQVVFADLYKSEGPDFVYFRAHDFPKIAELCMAAFEKYGANDSLKEQMQTCIDKHFNSDNKNSPRYWFHTTTVERFTDVALATLIKHGKLPACTNHPDWWGVKLPA